MKLCAALLALSLVVPATGASAAILEDATITEEYRVPDLGTAYADVTYDPQTFNVGAGQESTILLEGVTTFNVDFSDAALDLIFDTTLANPTFGSNASFNGIVFTSTAFSDVLSVMVSGNLGGFDSSRVSIVGDELRLNFAGLTYNTDTQVGLTFTGNPSAVPEPATWAMMLLGFGAAGTALRRSRRRKGELSQLA